MKLIDEVIKGLPLYYQKEDTIKYFKCFSPCIDYLDGLIEGLKYQTSILYAKGLYLDFIGDRFGELRQGRDDETYRQALITKKTAQDELPTTEFLLNLTRELTGHEVTDLQTRYKDEPASQFFRIDMLESFKDIHKMPDLNKIAEAGAKMYWELSIVSEAMPCTYNNIVEVNRKIRIDADFKIDQTVRIHANNYFGAGIGFTKLIRIGGNK